MFKKILELSLSNRLLVIVIGLAISIYGAFNISRAPIDVFPDLNKPTVNIMTEAGGMASEEVEMLITFPIESAMNGLTGVQSVRSTSTAGLSVIYVSFDWSVDIYRARQLVSEKLSGIESSLPPGVQPRMGPVSSIMGEILQIAIPLGANGASPMVAREYADWTLRPRLLSIPGIAQVIPIGGEVRQFQVLPDTRRMAELGITPEQLNSSLKGFSSNTSGGFLDVNGREYLIRNIGRTSKLDDLKNLAVGIRQGQPILLQQIAQVKFGPAIRRGDAGLNGQPAVILGIQKQPSADTVMLTQAVEKAIDELGGSLPTGMGKPQITFRQANFIESSIDTLKVKLIAASICVGVILYVFLGSLRPALIALISLPLSIVLTGIVFNAFGQTINTMTLGGLAIAIGGLVDDAVVDVENIIRRLTQRSSDLNHRSPSILETVRAASLEVRTGIVYATMITIIVFVPLFALPGIEGRFFQPLAIAFIISTLGSLLVSVTVTPVLSYYLLPKMTGADHQDSAVVRYLKHNYQRLLTRIIESPKAIVRYSLIAVVLAILSLPFMAKSFLPPFNEGTYLVSLRLNPGTTLTESALIASQGEALIMDIPEVKYVGRRTGRAELDEHAEGVHTSELDIGLTPSKEWDRSASDILQEIRAKLSVLPVAISIGQPISHRIDHMLSGSRTQIAMLIFGDNLETLRAQAELLKSKLSNIPGIADLEVEKQVLAPQIRVVIDYDRASQYGLSASGVNSMLQGLIEGERITQVIEGSKRFNLIVKLPEGDRSVDKLGNLVVDTPKGYVSLNQIATIEESDGPNQISRDGGKRRILISANASGNALSDVVSEMRKVIDSNPLPEGYFITIGGQFTAQEEASKLIGLLSACALAVIFSLLYSKYRSVRLSAIIMVNIPLAMIGGVFALWLFGQPLSIASMVGFVALAGVSIRNGILKISHYLNLILTEQKPLSVETIIQGSLERLSPVLMTALVTAFALMPLLFEANQPGTEILHPVAVVIFFGLFSSTLLDSFLTPILFLQYGQKDMVRIKREYTQNCESF